MLISIHLMSTACCTAMCGVCSKCGGDVAGSHANILCGVQRLGQQPAVVLYTIHYMGQSRYILLRGALTCVMIWYCVKLKVRVAPKAF